MSKTRQNSGVPIGSIAELRLTSGANEAVELLGYYTKGDGGGGTFYWDATSTDTDNGGTIIQATGVVDGRWIRNYNDKVMCKWFGASDCNGDESLDATSGVQAALNYAFTNNKELCVDGNYTIQATLTLPQAGVSVAKPILKISGYGSANNYSDEEQQSLLNAGSTLGDNIVLDLRYQCTIPTRFSIILADFNVTGRNTSNGCGIYISNAWTTIDRVCIQAHKEALVLNEIYKISIINSSIANNGAGIICSGYISVLNVTGCQLRANRTEGLFVLKTSNRKIAGETGGTDPSISQAHIAGNNVEGNENIFKLGGVATSTLIGVRYLGNYDEGVNYLIKQTSTNTKIKNCSFTELKYVVNVDIDYSDNLTLGGSIGTISTTDATGRIEFLHLPDYFNNKSDRSMNRFFPRCNLNRDWDFSMQSRVITPFTRPGDMGNSNVADGDYSWITSDSDRYRIGKSALSVINTSGTLKYLRWDTQVKGVKSFYGMDASYAYRIRVSYTYYIPSNRTLSWQHKMPGEISWTTSNRAGTAGWHTDVFTIDANPDEADDVLALKLNIDNGDELRLDNVIISYVSNPEIKEETMGVVGIGMAPATVYDLTLDAWETDMTWSAQSLGYNYNILFDRGVNDNVLEVSHDGANTIYPYITYIPLVNRY